MTIIITPKKILFTLILVGLTFLFIKQRHSRSASNADPLNLSNSVKPMVEMQAAIAPPLLSIPSVSAPEDQASLPMQKGNAWLPREYDVLPSLTPGIVAIKRNGQVLFVTRSNVKLVQCKEGSGTPCGLFSNGQMVVLSPPLLSRLRRMSES